jgi:CDP-glucose 4,6-dehydratase
MEGLVALMPIGMQDFYRNKRVFLTGHTGFKGAWLALWLSEMGAQVTGYALPPATDPNLFFLTGLEERIQSISGDIRDLGRLSDAISQAKPDLVFHLAAQALVRQSYLDPVGNYSTNLMGTVNLLEACRLAKSVKSIVIVTSDKCYENNESGKPYRDTDRLGGDDPYSSSKACVELITHAYRKSFYAEPSTAGVATARAGNVIGGGDWAECRIVPDCLRSLERNEDILIRNPESIRPWQHVLDPLHGYLQLAHALYNNKQSYASAWNFGPDEDACVTVQRLAQLVIQHWGSGSWRQAAQDKPFKESGVLRLDNAKAKKELEWQPRWNVESAIKKTVLWHKAYLNKADAYSICCEQIETYQQAQENEPKTK